MSCSAPSSGVWGCSAVMWAFWLYFSIPLIQSLLSEKQILLENLELTGYDLGSTERVQVLKEVYRLKPKNFETGMGCWAQEGQCQYTPSLASFTILWTLVLFGIYCIAFFVWRTADEIAFRRSSKILVVSFILLLTFQGQWLLPSFRPLLPESEPDSEHRAYMWCIGEDCAMQALLIFVAYTLIILPLGVAIACVVLALVVPSWSRFPTQSTADQSLNKIL